MSRVTSIVQTGEILFLRSFMPPQAVQDGGYRVSTLSRCPDVSPDVPRQHRRFFALRTNTERI